MSVPMKLADATDLVDVSIQKIFLKTTNLKLGDVMQIYHNEDTDDYYDKDSSLSGFSEAGRMLDNTIINTESPVQGFDKTYTQVFHGKMGQFTIYDWKFGIKKRKLEKVTGDITKSVMRKKERLLTEYLEKSINNTSSYTVTDPSGNWTKSLVGGDSQEFIDASHSREDGGAAWSNVISDGSTSNMDFAIDAIKAAHRTASLITDPMGNLMNIDLDTFVFRKGSDISFTAAEINGALGKNQAAQTAEHDGAPFGQFKIVRLPYLSTAAAAYFWGFDSSLMSDEMGLQVRTSQEVTPDKPEADYKTKTIYVSATAAFDYGHNDARLAVGSLGTNS